MAKEARKDEPLVGTIVEAIKEPANEKHDYYCKCDGCSAHMYAYALGQTNARFVSYNKFEHVSISCIPVEMEFDPTAHSEELFDMDTYIMNVCGEVKHIDRGARIPTSTEHRHVHIKTKPLTAINTTNDLYLQFCHAGLEASYNGYSVNEFFACRNNYEEKSHGFTGFQLVEASFYKYHPYTQYMDFNFTPYGKITFEPVHIRLDFGDKDKAFGFYKQHFADKKTWKPKKGVYTRLIVIAGVWEKLNSSDIISICKINKLTQIKFYD